MDCQKKCGLLTFYLVTTVLLTVRRPPGIDWMSAGAMIFA